MSSIFLVIYYYYNDLSGEANSVTILWDTIMTSMSYCGVNSYLDFVDEGSPEVGNLFNRESKIWYKYNCT